METETITRINLAVDEVVQRCAGGTQSVEQCIDAALAELREQGWVTGEVDLVHSIVERVINEREGGWRCKRRSTLTRSGTVYLDFRPHLTSEQYARLLEISEATDTAKELREAQRR